MEDKFRLDIPGYPLNAGAINANPPIIDTLGFKSIIAQVTGTFVGTIIPEHSVDGVTWQSAVGLSTTTGNGTSLTSIIGVGMYAFNCFGRFYRFRMSAWTSGTAVITPMLRTTDVEAALSTAIIGGTVSSNSLLGTGATGGSTARIRTTAAANQDAQVIKASAGNLADIFLVNRAAAERFVRFYDLASGATSASTQKFVIPLRAGQEVAINPSVPIRFGTGIMIRVTAAEADNDATAAVAGDVHGFIHFA